MRRTTIFLDEQLDRELKALARRAGRPTASLVREALADYVVGARETPPRGLGFVAAGRSGRPDTAERHEELLWKSPGRGRKR
jgi:predicted transcriptional regulator